MSLQKESLAARGPSQAPPASLGQREAQATLPCPAASAVAALAPVVAVAAAVVADVGAEVEGVFHGEVEAVDPACGQGDQSCQVQEEVPKARVHNHAEGSAEAGAFRTYPAEDQKDQEVRTGQKAVQADLVAEWIGRYSVSQFAS